MLFRYSPDEKGRAVRKALIYTKNEHGIQRDLVAPDAARIIGHLRNNGYEAYLVGGAVRDLLIGKSPKDFDIVTNAEPAKIKRIFRNSRIIGKRFRLVHIFFGETIYEVSTFRSLEEGTVGNSFGTMDDDVQRRDFTLNALYYDPIKEQVIDYVGGVKDIRARRIKPVIPLKTIFVDDPVRMLRAIKYAVSTDSAIPFSLGRAIRKHSSLLQPVSPSRLTEEIIKILNSGKAAGIVASCLRYDCFMYLQPNANSLIDSRAGFADAYRASLEELDALVAAGDEARLGRKIAFMIRDLVAIVADRAVPPAEAYAKAYQECRRFIMPMNPPRIELETAVRQCLKDIGINVRAARSRERGPRDARGPRKAEGEGTADAVDPIGDEPGRKRRRRQRKPNPVTSA